MEVNQDALGPRTGRGGRAAPRSVPGTASRLLTPALQTPLLYQRGGYDPPQITPAYGGGGQPQAAPVDAYPVIAPTGFVQPAALFAADPGPPPVPAPPSPGTPFTLPTPEAPPTSYPGRKRALLCACNYKGAPCELRGCVNDAKCMAGAEGGSGGVGNGEVGGRGGRRADRRCAHPSPRARLPLLPWCLASCTGVLPQVPLWLHRCRHRHYDRRPAQPPPVANPGECAQSSGSSRPALGLRAVGTGKPPGSPAAPALPPVRCQSNRSQPFRHVLDAQRDGATGGGCAAGRLALFPLLRPRLANQRLVWGRSGRLQRDGKPKRQWGDWGVRPPSLVGGRAVHGWARLLAADLTLPRSTRPPSHPPPHLLFHSYAPATLRGRARSLTTKSMPSWSTPCPRASCCTPSSTRATPAPWCPGG